MLGAFRFHAAAVAWLNVMAWIRAGIYGTAEALFRGAGLRASAAGAVV
jgi:hypothetical protein